MGKLVSVIMASNNAEKYIGQSIRSLQNQTYKDIEIIICDDCSSDSTLKIICDIAECDTRVIVLKNEKHLFAAGTRNKCLCYAKGDYIAIQDADDLSRPDRIEILVNALENNNKYDFVSSAEALFDKKADSPYKIVSHKIFPTKKNFLRGMCFCHAGTLFKKECLQKIGGYPELKKIHRHEDYLLFMNLYGYGFKGFNIDDCLYYYRVDFNAILRRNFKSCLEECCVRLKGFRTMRVLLIGLPFVFLPIFGYCINIFRKKKKALI